MPDTQQSSQHLLPPRPSTPHTTSNSVLNHLPPPRLPNPGRTPPAPGPPTSFTTTQLFRNTNLKKFLISYKLLRACPCSPDKMQNPTKPIKFRPCSGCWFFPALCPEHFPLPLWLSTSKPDLQLQVDLWDLVLKFPQEGRDCPPATIEGRQGTRRHSLGMGARLQTSSLLESATARRPKPRPPPPRQQRRQAVHAGCTARDDPAAAGSLLRPGRALSWGRRGRGVPPTRTAPPGLRREPRPPLLAPPPPPPEQRRAGRAARSSARPTGAVRSRSRRGQQSPEYSGRSGRGRRSLQPLAPPRSAGPAATYFPLPSKT